MTTFLILLLLSAVGILIGSIVFLSFVLAPLIFQTLDAAAASRLLRALFPRYYRLGLLCSAIGLGTSVVLASMYPSAAAAGCAALLSGMVISIGYSLRLVPRINAARDNGSSALFEALHLRSVVLNGANLFLAIGALVLAAMASPGLA